MQLPRQLMLLACQAGCTTQVESEQAVVLLQWPTRELCPLCMLPSLGSQQDIMWNEDEVYRFLVHFYQGSSPQASQDVTGAAAGYKDGGNLGRCEPSAGWLPLADVRSIPHYHVAPKPTLK